MWQRRRGRREGEGAVWGVKEMLDPKSKTLTNNGWVLCVIGFIECVWAEGG